MPTFTFSPFYFQWANQKYQPTLIIYLRKLSFISTCTRQNPSKISQKEVIIFNTVNNSIIARLIYNKFLYLLKIFCRGQAEVYYGVFRSSHPETTTQVFSCEFCEISKNNFSYRTSGKHLESLFNKVAVLKPCSVSL